VTSAGFDAAWSAGAALPLEEAVAAALEAGPAPAPSPSPPADGATSLLTPREREVAVLVAQGLTNRQVAEQLVVTEKTASNHVQRVLDKLGIHSRAQLAARAEEFGVKIETP
jgi:non-specific serine/threonine protein kinase